MEFLSSDFETFKGNPGVKTVANSALSMHDFAGFPHQYWEFAYETAVYVRNLSPTSGNPSSMTPFELWHGRKPDVSHLRIFGEPGYVHVPKNCDINWMPRLKSVTSLVTDTLTESKFLKCWIWSLTGSKYRVTSPSSRHPSFQPSHNEIFPHCLTQIQNINTRNPLLHRPKDIRNRLQGHLVMTDSRVFIAKASPSLTSPVTLLVEVPTKTTDITGRPDEA